MTNQIECNHPGHEFVMTVRSQIDYDKMILNIRGRQLIWRSKIITLSDGTVIKDCRGK